jgi:GDP-4-dehydro-6-deoxy-D-mannose reductase
VRAVITGAAGFVGRHLSSHLDSQGDEVVSVDRDHDVTDVEDISSVLKSAAPEVVYHLAALSHVGESWEDPSDVMRVNVLGTSAVLSAARAVASSALVLVVSSAEVYGVVDPTELPLTELSPVRPSSPYAASKAAAELVALQAWRGYGQRVVVVRPFNHVGPGQAPTFFVPALASRLVAARTAGTTEIAVGNLTARRDFTDVRDVVRAYRLVAERGVPGAIYNVCSGRDVVLSDVAARLRTLAYPDARFVEDESLMRPVEIPALRGDPSQLREATTWTQEIDLNTTLRDVVADAEARATDTGT